MDELTETAVICTLTTKDRVSQTLEWTDLQAISRSSEPLPNGARTTYDLEHADAIDDLVRREMHCCGSWLGITTTRAEVLTVEITTENSEGVDLIRNMAGVSEP